MLPTIRSRGLHAGLASRGPRNTLPVSCLQRFPALLRPASADTVLQSRPNAL